MRCEGRSARALAHLLQQGCHLRCSQSKAMAMVFGTFICKWSFHLLVSAARVFMNNQLKNDKT